LGFLRWKLSSSIPASRDLLVALMSSLETCKVPKLFQVVQLGGITLWSFNIAMENGPFIDGLPIKNGDFP